MPSNGQRIQPKTRRDDANRRVEVTVETDIHGEREVVLKDMSFGNGIGWYTEKSVRLDSKQVEALLRSLCACRRHPSTEPSVAPVDCSERENGEAARILTFPTVLPSS